MSAASHSDGLRFCVESWGRLETFFVAYEECRRRRGFGEGMLRVTPQQRADALAIIGGLNASGGWRRVGAEGSEAVWLRHLAPLLAETGKAADALREAAKQGLPGSFEPAPATWRPAVVPEPAATAAPVSPPAPGPPSAVAPPNAGALAVVLAALAVAGLLILAWKAGPAQAPAPDACSVCPGAALPRKAPELGPGNPNPTRADINAAAKPIWEELADLGRDASARALAEIEASRGGPSAETYLVAMLRRWPADPDDRAVGSGAVAGREWAIAAIALRLGVSENRVAREIAGEITAGLGTPPRVPVPPAPAYAPWPTWPRWLAFAPLAALAALGWSRLPAETRAGLRAAAERERGIPITLRVAPEKPQLPGSTRDLARRLGSRRPVNGRTLDAERSIDATLANHGLLTPVARPASRAIEYLFLIARRHPRDHERDRVLRLVDLLREGGAPVEAFDYDPDPQRLFPVIRGGRALRQQGAPLDLRALAEMYPFANLVLVTDGEDLVDFLSRRPRDFVAEQLARWPRKMLLTPAPRAEWGEREWRLSQKLGGLVGRATVEGLEDLVSGLRPTEGKPLFAQALDYARGAPAKEGGAAGTWADFLHDRLAFDFMPARPAVFAHGDPRLVSEVAPGEAQRRDLLRDLRGWLGAHGFYWFAACAAFPQLRFEVTLHLGQTLERGAIPGAPKLFDERLLARLTLLPWFRVGRMPLWLRKDVFAALSPEQRIAARAEVERLLAKPPGDGIDLETGLPVRSGGETMVDRMMADVLIAGNGDDLTPETNVPALAEIRRAAQLRAWLNYAARLSLAGVWCLGAWRFWPASERGPLPLGSWWPLAAYLAATALGGAYVLRYALVDAWRRLMRGGSTK